MSQLPNVYLFNPTCEMAIANETVSWRPNRFLQQFEADLEVLPSFFALPQDIVMVSEIPSEYFLDQLERAGFQSPKFMLFEKALTDLTFRLEPKNELRPWGWSPMMLHRLKSLFPSCSENFNASPSVKWSSEKKHMHSRFFSLSVLEETESYNQSGNWIGRELFPKVCHSEQEIVAAHSRFGKSMLKAPWSSSGRGLLPVRLSNLNAAILNWANGIIKKQGYVMCEPLLHKIADFSFQFEIRNQDLTYLGNTWFFTDEKGQYRGHELTHYSNIQPKEVCDLFEAEEMEIVAALIAVLKPKLSLLYEGFFGVDAMIIRNDSGLFMIHPCLEINLRYNMGLLSMRLSEIFKHRYSRFEIMNYPNKLELKNKLVLTPITGKTNHIACLSAEK